VCVCARHGVGIILHCCMKSNLHTAKYLEGVILYGSTYLIASKLELIVTTPRKLATAKINPTAAH